MKRFFYTLLLSACTASSLLAHALLVEGERPVSDLDTMPANNVNDTLMIEQNTEPFTTQVEPMSDEEQLFYDAEYNAKHFEPWMLSQLDLSEGEKTWQFKYAKQETYRRNGERIPTSWYEQQIANSNFEAFNSVAQPGIVIHHTDMKLYPSDSEIYYDPRRVGEGFPFDYNQNSAVHINTPIFISHFSQDHAWAYVKTAYAFGWVSADDIALVSSAFQSAFQNGKYAITITDNLNIVEKKKNLSLVKMGTLFPIDYQKRYYLFAGKDKKGYAYLKYFRANKINLISKKPIKFNPKNIAFISKQLVGEPYGWGGKLQSRDCSALTRDFFAPFGIYLPRNSSQQARESMGEYISLAGLDQKTRKEMIVSHAKPFRSLLYVPGHITLYLGEKNGEPIILHNYWGVRLKSGDKYIMGRAIITTTHPGAERPDVREPSMLSNTLRGVVNF